MRTKIRYLVGRTLNDLRNPLFVKQMTWALLFWIVAILSITLSIQFLKTHYPNPVRPDDLILDLIPQMGIFITVGELLSAVQVALIVYIMWEWRFKPAPKLIFLVGVMFMLRGFAIVLTPLAQIHSPAETYAEGHIIARNFYYGMFFSGHTASAFIQAFYVKEHRLRSLVFVVATGQVFSLLASHSHYTIDVFGGLLVAYFITHFDFMTLVPERLRDVKWMPWYTGEAEQVAVSPDGAVSAVQQQREAEPEREVTLG